MDAHSRGVKCSQRGCAGEKWLQFQQIIFLDGMAIVMSNEFIVNLSLILNGECMRSKNYQILNRALNCKDQFSTSLF